MNRKTLLSFIMILGLVIVVSKTLPAAGKPDVTTHEATYMESTVSMHIEWQSPNPVVMVKITIANKQQEIKVDPYDNKRNRDGYAGEVNVTVGLDWVPNQPFNYIIQLEDELRVKSSLAKGKVKVSSYQQPGVVIQPQQPSMQIQIQQNITQPGAQPGIQPGALPGVLSGGQQGGSLIVIIAPLIAAEGGAMWRAGDGQWKRSGEAIPDLPVGIHTIEFQDLGGWIKPQNQNVVIEGGQPLTLNGIYNK